MNGAPGRSPSDSGPQTRVPAPQPSLPPTAAERGGIRALLQSIAGMLFLFLPVLGAALIGLALLVAGVVTGVRARRRARRILTRAPGATGGIVIGSIGLGLAAAGLILGVVLAKEFGGYQECRETALTITDRQTCQDKYFPMIERRLHLPKGSLNRYRSVM